MAASPKKKIILWVILYPVMGAIDLIQLIIDFTGVGIAVSEIAEPFIGVILATVLQLSGVSIITKPKRLGSLLAALGLDAITLGAAPFWILDVLYIHYDYRREQAQLQVQLEDRIPATSARPLYANGARQPTPPPLPEGGRNPNTKPLVSDGVRAPQK